MAVKAANLTYAIGCHAIMIVFYSIQAALLPSLLAMIFPIHMRYTGIGFSFNICDGILWGLILTLTSNLAHYKGDNAAFILLLPISAVIFLRAYFSLREKYKLI
jgi:hypothetical protein